MSNSNSPQLDIVIDGLSGALLEMLETVSGTAVGRFQLLLEALEAIKNYPSDEQFEQMTLEQKNDAIRNYAAGISTVVEATLVGTAAGFAAVGALGLAGITVGFASGAVVVGFAGAATTALAGGLFTQHVARRAD